MDLSSFDFLPLGEDTEILPFDCNDADLNNFLFDDAKNYLSDLMAVTYLFVDRQANKTVAYFSLLNDKVSYDPEERSLWNRINRRISNNKRRKTYPSVKIGRLAVSKDYDNKGIGRAILDFIKHAFTNGNRTGCRFITVDAYATSSRSRMLRLGRKRANVSPNNRRSLFSSLFFFTIKSPIQYKTFVFEKKSFPDVFSLEGRMAKQFIKPILKKRFG